MVDPSSMEQAFLNIILNAYKADATGNFTQLMNGDKTEAVQFRRIPASESPSRTFPVSQPLFLDPYRTGRD